MADFDGPVVPDIAGEIVGWRAWQVLERRWPRLLSFNYTEWPAGAWLEAECDHDHTPPAQGCSCGVYAAANESILHAMRYPRYDDGEIVVCGEVGLTGKVIRGTRGYRAQRARPLRLFIPFDEWEIGVVLREAYDVPIVLANTFDLPRAAAG